MRLPLTASAPETQPSAACLVLAHLCVLPQAQPTQRHCTDLSKVVRVSDPFPGRCAATNIRSPSRDEGVVRKMLLLAKLASETAKEPALYCPSPG